MPKELPPSFGSQLFADASSSLTLNDKSKWRSPVRYSLGLPGGARRILAIPHPIVQTQAVEEITTNWGQYRRHLLKSKISVSTPTVRPSGRSITTELDYANLLSERVVRRRTARYLLTADISQFYGSIYTHTLSWALNSKKVAKAKLRDDKLLGNKLDWIIGYGQEGHTSGIPIGPDTSLVVAEVVLAAIDLELEQAGVLAHDGCMRFMDDYDLLFDTKAEAEQAKAFLELALNRYQLALNPTKTSIQELPVGLEEDWRTELHQFSLRDESEATRVNDLHSFFSRVFSLRGTTGSGAIFSYAIQRTRSLRLGEESWRTFVGLALSAVHFEPTSLRYLIEILLDGMSLGKRIPTSDVAATLNSMVREHALLHHGYEVSWALWGLAALGLELDDVGAACVAEMHDDISIILFLYLREIGLLTSVAVPTVLTELSQLDGQGLDATDHWLLAYEATRHGWHPVTAVKTDQFYKQLLTRRITFFEGVSLPIRRRVRRIRSFDPWDQDDLLEYPLMRLSTDSGGGSAY